MANIYADIELNRTTGDLLISSTGDWQVVANSNEQSASLIIQLFPGNLKQFPLVGVGIQNYLAGPIDANAIGQAIRVALTQDGFVVEMLSVGQNGDINLTASR